MSKSKLFAYLVIFLALSIVGAGIKIPIGISSLALDSAPALLSAIVLGPIYGAVVGGIGHLLSALLGGLPLGPLHFLVAIEMFIILFLFGIVFKLRLTRWSFVLFIFCNAILAPIPFYFLLSPSFYWTLLIPIGLSSICNAGIVAFIHKPLLNHVKKRSSTYA